MAAEADVGICAFVTPTILGFDGELKTRYSDFFVNEIDENGIVVRLTDTSVPKPASAPGDGTDQRLRLCAILGEALLFDIETLNSALPDDPPKPQVSTPPLLKEHRKAVHEGVRALFLNLESSAAPSEGSLPPGQSSIVIFRKAAAGSKRPRNQAEANSEGPALAAPGVQGHAAYAREPWPSHVPDYLSFTLHKRNVDTLSAIHTISELTRINSRSFSFAGRKDRRGITAQTVTAYRVQPKRLVGLNRQFRGDILVGNFRFTESKAALGALQGNRFSIVVRGARAPATHALAASAAEGDPALAVSEAMAQWEAAGYRFMNYFGLQRFGTAAGAGTHEVGRALLQQRWHDAAELILRPRAGETEGCLAARLLFERTGDAKAALAKLPHFLVVETALLDVLAHFQKTSTLAADAAPAARLQHADSSLAAACAAIPAPSRALFINSYQSVLWNRTATLRAQLGLFPIIGDLVFADAASAAAAERDIVRGLVEDGEQDGASARRAPTIDVADDKAMGTASLRHDEGDTLLPSVRALTAADIARGAYTIADVVLPLPGSAVVFPGHEVGASAVAKMMLADGFVLDPAATPAVAVHAAWAAGPRAFTATGGYRKLVAAAESVRWRLIKHARPDDDLQISDAECVLQMAADSAAASGPVPLDEFPLLSVAASGGGGTLHALQLCFSLRSSCYATMALREVMKQTTERGAGSRVRLTDTTTAPASATGAEVVSDSVAEAVSPAAQPASDPELRLC